MIKRKLALAICCMVSMILCNACGAKSEEMTTISINKDGSVHHTIIEEFGAGYQIAELETLIDSEVATYQSSNYTATAKDVTVEKIQESEGDMVLVKMYFPTVTDFVNFQNFQSLENRTFFFGTVKDAMEAGYECNVTLHERQDDSKLLNRNALLNYGDHSIIIYDVAMNYDSNLEAGAPVLLRTFSNILAVSDNLVIQDDKSVWVGNTTDLAYVLLDK